METSQSCHVDREYGHLSRRGVNRNMYGKPHMHYMYVTSRAEVGIETTMMMVLKMIKAVTSRAEV